VFERILVAFDGSPESQHAGTVAIDLAAKFGSSVTVATVHPDSGSSSDGHLESLVPLAHEGKSLAQLIEELRRSAVAAGVRSVESVALYGEVVPALLDYLATHAHELVITGSRGLSRGRRLLVGSVSTGLVGRAPCPVLVVPSRRGRRAGK
jgi:nucleotide-binding universal stress UspA family protein